MKRLWRVTAEFTVYVAADTKEAADGLARQAAVEEFSENSIMDFFSVMEAHSLNGVDDDWQDCPPRGDNPDLLTCKEILAAHAGHDPEPPP